MVADLYEKWIVSSQSHVHEIRPTPHPGECKYHCKQNLCKFQT